MKRLLFITLMVILVFGIKAQNVQQNSIENQYPNDATALEVSQASMRSQLDSATTGVRTTWISNRPADNWFISISGGVADLMSEESRYVNFGDRIKPTVGFSVGKWLSPVWGVRLNVTGAELQGFTTWTKGVGGLGDWYTGKNYTTPSGNNATNNYITAYEPANAKFIEDRFLNMNDKISTKEGDGYSYDLTYGAASLDFLLNLKNLFTTYNPKAFFNPVLYGGMGLAHTFKDGDRTAINSMMEKFGLMLNFRLGDSWDIFLDGQYLILPEVFDRRVGDGSTQDLVGNYSLGFTYKFNFRHFIKADLRNPSEIAALNDEINELRKRPVSCPPVVVCPPVVPCPECPKVSPVDVLKTPVTKQNLTFLPTPVFFKINSSVIDDAQWNSIQKAAEYLQENPGKRIKVTGYADKKTGTAAGNKKLSENRAKSVYDSLVKRYNIAPSRIETSFLGDEFQPFSENDWNRVVIFVIP